MFTYFLYPYSLWFFPKSSEKRSVIYDPSIKAVWRHGRERNIQRSLLWDFYERKHVAGYYVVGLCYNLTVCIVPRESQVDRFLTLVLFLVFSPHVSHCRAKAWISTNQLIFLRLDALVSSQYWQVCRVNPSSASVC